MDEAPAPGEIPVLSTRQPATKVKRGHQLDPAPFIRFLEERECAARTIETYGSTLRKFAATSPLLSLETVSDFLRGYGGASRRTIAAQIRSYCKWAEVDIPWNKIAQPKVRTEMPRALSTDEQRRVHRWLSNRDEYAAKIFLFLLHTGLRVGEALALKPRDLQDDTRGRHLIVRYSKTRRFRTVPLDQAASRLINDLGLPLTFSRQRFNDLIIGARTDLGLEPFVIHSLRKTCLTRLAAGGADAGSLAQFAGHSIATASKYVRYSPENVRDGVFGRQSSRAHSLQKETV